MMNHLDLFSGIGGFALAAKWAGFQTVQFVEKDSFCQKVLEKNFPNVPIHSDIKDFHYSGQIDLLTGGFPCQPFSVAGNKKGKDDDRYLWPEMLRIIKECRPRWIIIENVPGIISYLDPILEDLEREGYECESCLIPASAIGAPHKRERLWIIAHYHSERCHIGCDNRQERYFSNDWKWYISQIYKEWSQFIPESWKTFNAQDWLGFSTDAASERLQGKRSSRQSLHSEENRKGETAYAFNDSFDPFFGWKKDQPPIPGVDDGLPNGMDRNKALGNAIVPQVIYPILRMIYFLDAQNA